jgi:hypothetical protein
MIHIDRKCDKRTILSLLLFQGTNFVDDNVTPNKEYEYRVTAVNDEGPGEPSDSSSGIFAKPEKGKIVD